MAAIHELPREPPGYEPAQALPPITNANANANANAAAGARAPLPPAIVTLYTFLNKTADTETPLGPMVRGYRPLFFVTEEDFLQLKLRGFEQFIPTDYANPLDKEYTWFPPDQTVLFGIYCSDEENDWRDLQTWGDVAQHQLRGIFYVKLGNKSLPEIIVERLATYGINSIIIATGTRHVVLNPDNRDRYVVAIRTGPVKGQKQTHPWVRINWNWVLIVAIVLFAVLYHKWWEAKLA